MSPARIPRPANIQFFGRFHRDCDFLSARSQIVQHCDLFATQHAKRRKTPRSCARPRRTPGAGSREKAKAERDRLAEELAGVYPAIAELVARIDANDKQIDVLNNHARPSGAERLRVAELVSRGIPGFSFAPEAHHEGFAPPGVRVLGAFPSVCEAVEPIAVR
jgi:hypothetical protein